MMVFIRGRAEPSNETDGSCPGLASVSHASEVTAATWLPVDLEFTVHSGWNFAGRLT